MANLPTARLKFTQLSPTDFPLYALLVMDEAVMKFITGNALSFEDAQLRFQKALKLGQLLPDAGFFLVRKIVDDEFIGVSKLVQIADNQYEVGYMVLPQHWGKGFASEMTAYMIALARKNHFTGDLIGIVDPENPASIKVLAKFGFELYYTGQIDGLDAAYYKLECT
jgi:[ribosomal protein S5]-alanine N-acetyltransferase